MSANISRIVYHVDMNSHPVSIHGMKTVYTAVADQGSGPGPRPSLISVWMNAAPLPLYLKVFIRHCSTPESGTETYRICGDPLSRSTRPSLAPLQNLAEITV